MSPLPDGGTWDSLQDQMRAKPKPAQMLDKITQRVIATSISGLTNISAGQSESNTRTKAKSQGIRCETDLVE